MAVLTKDGKPRFATVNEEEFLAILQNKDSANTQRATEKCVTGFKAYLTSKGMPLDFEEWEKPRLAEVLSKFYVEVRREDGKLYKTGSMINIRAGLNRYLKSKGKAIDLIKEPVFAPANLSFQAQQVKLKEEDRGDTEHYPEIDENDLHKLYQSGVLNEETPKGLLYKVWFELMLYICRRGRENLRKLIKQHFQIGKDSQGRRYVYQSCDEMTKRSRDNSSSRVDAGRMYETRVEGCPVKTSKLNPKCDALFQTPMLAKKDDFDWEPCHVWYKNCPIGERTLGEMMAKISKEADLSKRYTNHSLRPTCIQILDSGGFATRDICNVSGHSNERSHRSYVRQPCDAKKRKMSDTIALSTTGRPGVESSKPSTSSAPPVESSKPSTSSAPPVESSKPSTSSAPPAPAMPPGPRPSTPDLPDISEEFSFDLLPLTSSQELELDSWLEETTSSVQTSSSSSAASETVTNLHQVRQRVQMAMQPQPPMQFHGCNVTVNINFNK